MPLHHFGIKITSSGASSPSPSPAPSPSPSPSPSPAPAPASGWFNGLQSVLLNNTQSWVTGSSNSVWFSNNPSDVENIMCAAADPDNLITGTGNTIGFSSLAVGGSVHQYQGNYEDPTLSVLFGGSQIFVLEYPYVNYDQTFHINNPYYNDYYKNIIGYERTYAAVTTVNGYITSIDIFTSCSAPTYPQPATSLNTYVFERLTGLGFNAADGKTDNQVLRDAQASGNLITTGAWPGFAAFGEVQNVLNESVNVPYGADVSVPTSVWPTGILGGIPVVGAKLLDSNGNGKHYPNGVINYENGKGSNWYLIRTNSSGTITSVTILYRPS